MRILFRAMSCVMLSFMLCMAFVSCNSIDKPADVWANAVYTDDTELGNGSEKLEVEVRAEEKSVVFTIHTNKKTVGEALLEHNLISGENGAYGMYVKEVNGIIADYDVNQCYWSFSRNGEYLQTGVDRTEFESGEHFELVYTAQ